MYHADVAEIRGRDWAVAAWTILVMAAVLGLLSSQTSQLIGDHFPFGGRAITSAAIAATYPQGTGAARRGVLPMIMTVRLAVTRTQRTMVARMKHGGKLAAHTGRIHSGMKSAQGLLAGLALIGASQAR